MAQAWMLITGCAIAGWIFVEMPAAFGKVRIPFMMNVLGAISGGLIAAYFVL